MPYAVAGGPWYPLPDEYDAELGTFGGRGRSNSVSLMTDSLGSLTMAEVYGLRKRFSERLSRDRSGLSCSSTDLLMFHEPAVMGTSFLPSLNLPLGFVEFLGSFFERPTNCFSSSSVLVMYRLMSASSQVVSRKLSASSEEDREKDCGRLIAADEMECSPEVAREFDPSRGMGSSI